MMAAKKKVVVDLYLRISKDYDGTLRSVEDQELLGMAWLREHEGEGYVLGEIHRDPFLSAWNRKVVRPSFQKLVARLESGAADAVWVRNLDRFTRKVDEAEALLQLAIGGTRVIAEDGEYDLKTSRGRKAFRQAAIDGAEESDKISERSTRGKKMKALRGKSNATHRGFARDGFLPNPPGWEPGDPRVPVPPEQLASEQEVVRNAADRVLAGETLNSVATDLNDKGVRTVTGATWNGQNLRQLLLSPTLAGVLVHQGQAIGRMEGDHALTEETHDRLVAHFASRKQGRPPVTYLLSGVLRCGKCGAKLYGRPVVSQTPYPDGEVRRQYWCQYSPGSSVTKMGCGTLTIDQRFADRVIEKAVLRRLSDPRHRDQVARYAAHVAETRAALVAEKVKLEGDADVLASKVAAWGMSRVEAAMGPIDARLEEVKAQLLDLEVESGGAGEYAAEDWLRANMAQKRAMVGKAFPDGVWVMAATSRGKASLDPKRFQFADPATDRVGDTSGEGAGRAQTVA